MENGQETNVMQSLFDRTGEYLETRMDLVKLKAVKKSSEVVSSIASQAILAVIFFFFFIVLNIGIGLWLGDLMNKNYYGFFTLAAFYLIAGLIIYVVKDKLIKTPVANAIIKKTNS